MTNTDETDKACEEAWRHLNFPLTGPGSFNAAFQEIFNKGFRAGWEAAQKQAALQHILREDASLLDKLADLEAAEKKPL